MAAVEKQGKMFTHTAFQVMAYESYIALAEKLNKIAPVKGPAKTIFFTTGAEAVENAVKIARAYTGRPAVISFSGAFHGRTLLTMGLTGKVVPYKAGFGPFPGDIYHVPFPMAAHGVGPEAAFEALDRLFKADLEPARVAAMIIEPVQGEGGFYIAPVEFLRRLRALADQHGIMLIADEIQCGFARTGKMFAIEHSGVKPDLVTVAKSLAGGFPLSGVIGRQEVMDAPGPGGLGGTYAGSPVGCAAGLAVLEVIEEEKLLDRSEELGRRVTERLRSIALRNDVPPIGDIRNLGGMIAFELVKSRGSNEPDADMTKKVTAKALDNGLVLLSCGVYANTIRILVPLTASNKIVDEGLDIIERSLIQAAAA
jgi:4-aminobutyrate aminotransferase/(S)-3-amino-2-methylpropionate transaminase